MKLVRRVVSPGYNTVDSVEGSGPETKYMALVENPSLLALTSVVVNDLTGGVAEMEGVLKLVDRLGTTYKRMAEDDVRSGELVELDVATRAGELVELNVVTRAEEVAEETVKEAGVGEGLSDDETLVSGGGIWLVMDDSSSELVTATGGPFWFPSGPGRPFLLFTSPGAFVFTGSRAASDSRRDRGFVGL